MAQINISNLTFCYEGSYDNVFEEASFSIDTNWKLGLIGRNGKGKTTFLKLLQGRYEYQGSITSPVLFDYFPYPVGNEEQSDDVIAIVERLQPDYEWWKICRELDLLKVDEEVLSRPYRTLSHGERTKVMLAVLFSREQYFLLIDEPTNHLDMPARTLVCDYLNQKKGFILVSHDRSLLDACIDHVLVLERNQILVEKGNFSSWWDNKERRDRYEESEHERLKKDIRKLEDSARRTAAWADQVESTKIGFDPVRENDRTMDNRAYVGEKSRRMQQRRKNLERRQAGAIEDKSRLLKNIERPAKLKLMPLTHHKEVYVKAADVQLFYGDIEAVRPLSLELRRGECLVIQGRNGCGKSSLIKAILTAETVEVIGGLPDSIRKADFRIGGQLTVAAGLKVSYINQDTSFLTGSLDDYIRRQNLDSSLLKAILRQLDFERVQFDKPMDEYSEGQKKKVLLASSLLKPAHLYVWDEPLNYIDVFSRMQIEKLIRAYRPAMLIIEHDRTFAEQIGARIVTMED